MTREEEFDWLYMDFALSVAKLSRCEKKKVGAVAVCGTSIIDFGFNGTSHGWHTNVCEDKDGKTTEDVVHAEENIVSKCARTGKSLEGSSVYVNYAPCKKCARLLFQSGVDKVYFLENNRHGGIPMLIKLGVNVVQL